MFDMSASAAWPPPGAISPIWFAVTRVGDSEILLPIFFLAGLWLLRARRPRTAGGDGASPVAGARGTAARWFAGVLGMTLLVVASKVAFLGFGLGIRPIDFTGFSGHAFYASAILPVVGALLFGRIGVLPGAVLALVVVYSRVVVHAHSWSEALSGMVLGAAVAGWTLARLLREPAPARMPAWLPVAVAAWLVVLPHMAPPSRTNDFVVALSLKLSGRTQPYTRHELQTGAIGRVALEQRRAAPAMAPL